MPGPVFQKLIPRNQLEHFYDWNNLKELFIRSRSIIESENDFVLLEFYLNGKSFKYDLSQFYDHVEHFSLEQFNDSTPYSFRLTNVQRLSGEIREACQLLEKHYQRTVVCNLYFTPGPDKNCFTYHVDHQDTYIVQLNGAKTWLFPLDESGNYFRYIKDGSFEASLVKDYKKKSILVEKGSQFAVPHALVHKAEIQGSGPSIHLTFATIDFHNLDLFQELMGQLLKSAGLESVQKEKLDMSDISDIVQKLLSKASSLSEKEIVEAIQSRVFLENLKISKSGRNYKKSKPSNPD